MSFHQAAIWTCDRCGVQASQSPRPLGWGYFQFLDGDGDTNRTLLRGDVCNICKDELINMIAPGMDNLRGSHDNGRTYRGTS